MAPTIAVVPRQDQWTIMLHGAITPVYVSSRHWFARLPRSVCSSACGIGKCRKRPSRTSPYGSHNFFNQRRNLKAPHRLKDQK